MQVPEHRADWSQSSNHLGSGYHNARHARKAQEARPAGVTSYEAGYAAAANEFPNFERQKIRAIYDEAITNGAKVPHPALLRNYPSHEPPTARPQDDALDRTNLRRPGSGRSARSGASKRSGRSQGSHRSVATSVAGSAIAASVASSGPPPGYLRQARTPVTMYTTTSDLYGAGGHVGKEPSRGRELWLTGRGGGQISSYDNCLVTKGRHVPAC